MLGSVGRWGTLVVVGLFAGPVVAQVPVPRIPALTTPTSTGPGSQGWPVPLGQTAPQVVQPSPTPLLETPPSAFSGQPSPGVVLDQEGLPPLAGSLSDDFNKEVAGRRSFQYCNWENTRVSLFPSTLLWEPPLASKREARLQVMPTNFQNYVNKWTLETSIGTTAGILRVEPAGRDLAYQLDVFGVVHTRLSPDDLMASDYRFGVPLTARWGNWQGKLAYEHTSAHLGDEFQRNTGRLPINFAKDEAVLGVSRTFPEFALRVYGQVSYAFMQDLAGDPDRKRYDAGFQWVCQVPTGLSGAPFVAAHIEARGDQDFDPNFVAQVGWLWRNPYQRLANFRVYAEYYKGRSPYGQFFKEREDFYGLGFACDY